MKRAPVFGKSFAPFQEAYPTVKAVQVKVVEHTMPGLVIQTFTEQSMQPSVSCSNPSCTGGGVLLDALMSQMIAAKRVDLKETSPCIGQEVFTRNHVRCCLHSFTVEIHLEYLP